MQKQEIINILQDVRDSNKEWIKQGKIIVDGMNLDLLEEPVDAEDSDFSKWCDLNEDKVSSFSWFEELQLKQQEIHEAYSDLFFGCMRKYKPKTRNELMDDYELLCTKTELFKDTLNDIESQVNEMSDKDFDDSMTNSETEVSEVEQENDTDTEEMQTINIDKFDDSQNSEPETIALHESVDEEIKDTMEDVDSSIFDKNLDEVNLAAKSLANASRKISLKEQSIVQLQQEKELSKLELSHIEETQKLTKQSIEQLDEYYTLKQEEIELEKTDNAGFIEFKTNAKKQAEADITAIEEKRLSLTKSITDLEELNHDEQLKQEENKKEVHVEEQLEELKSNKITSLKAFKESKKARENDLEKLKEQVLLLEEELSDMESDIEKKELDIAELEEKEQLKKEERLERQAEYEKAVEERNISILDMQKEIDDLSEEDKLKNTELQTINFQVEELKKSNIVVNETHAEELRDLEIQQQSKREKLKKADDLKSAKLDEIKDLDIRITGLERSIENLKSESNEEKQNEKELETNEA